MLTAVLHCYDAALNALLLHVCKLLDTNQPVNVHAWWGRSLPTCQVAGVDCSAATGAVSLVADYAHV